MRRRTEFRLRKRKDRLHLVEGLLVAILDIDEVIQVIRTSDDAEAARARLRTVFDLSEPQAEYILELRLRRLTRFSRIELEREQAELTAEIARLQALLADESLLRTQVSDEMAEVAAAYGTPRRTILLESAGGSAVSGAPAARSAAAGAVSQVALHLIVDRVAEIDDAAGQIDFAATEVRRRLARRRIRI